MLTGWDSLQAVADARASVLKGCETEVLIEGAAGESKNPSTFFCNVQSNALDLSIKKDVIIKAANTAAASAGCYENDSVTSILAAEVSLWCLRACLLPSLPYCCVLCYFGWSSIHMPCLRKCKACLLQSTASISRLADCVLAS